jgi:hypothetical protein
MRKRYHVLKQVSMTATRTCPNCYHCFSRTLCLEDQLLFSFIKEGDPQEMPTFHVQESEISLVKNAQQNEQVSARK